MILKPFNGVFFAVLGATALLIVLLWVVFRNKTEKTRKIALITLCTVNLAVFCVYKYFLSIDPGYSDLFNWWSELPLHLCNINLFLIPIGVLTKKRGLMGFSFFLAPLGAVMALVFPSEGFSGYSLALPRMWGFYATHTLIIVCGITLATFNLYRPHMKDLPKITVTFVILGAASLGVNALLQTFAHCKTANYFFSWKPEGISILEMFWKWIPIRFLYELPALVILFVYASLICGLFKLFENHKNEPQTDTENTPEDMPETVMI